VVKVFSENHELNIYIFFFIVKGKKKEVLNKVNFILLRPEDII
jgi:hypothetical protein